MQQWVFTDKLLVPDSSTCANGCSWTYIISSHVANVIAVCTILQQYFIGSSTTADLAFQAYNCILYYIILYQITEQRPGPVYK